MRVVVMDRELHEPLTVIEAPMWFMRELEAGKRSPILRFAVPQETKIFYETPALDGGASLSYRGRDTEIQFERVMRGPRGEHLFWFAYANDPETVMLLRAAFLPGQVAENQRLRREAYVRGAFDMAFGRPD